MQCFNYEDLSRVVRANTRTSCKTRIMAAFIRTYTLAPAVPSLNRWLGTLNQQQQQQQQTMKSQHNMSHSQFCLNTLRTSLHHRLQICIDLGQRYGEMCKLNNELCEVVYDIRAIGTEDIYTKVAESHARSGHHDTWSCTVHCTHVIMLIGRNLPLVLGQRYLNNSNYWTTPSVITPSTHTHLHPPTHTWRVCTYRLHHRIGL